ncbi:MAG TPA: nucleotidyltransferase domain-containing protein [Xanthobacteraceae bacterium]|jgi:predicted nucleotidyltransferase|nr:nucleotidyltransferase domain-containing protein [Xanthobacteraceae bacterium]
MAENQTPLLARLVDDLSRVPGVHAIALGGSRARGSAGARSDYDIGLYYEPGAPFDVALLQKVAVELDDRGPAATVTPIGAWGQWINGGGWLTVEGERVDLLYRDLQRVRAAIADCREGRIERDYQPGHPHAFVSSIYMGEVACGRILWDPAGSLAALKELTNPYPRRLAEAVIDAFLWEAEFALENARHGRGLEDATYVMGCSFRCIACLCQVLFAVNGVYLLNEKGAVAATASLARRPDAFAARAAASLQAVLAGRPADGLQELDRLVSETRALT